MRIEREGVCVCGGGGSNIRYFSAITRHTKPSSPQAPCWLGVEIQDCMGVRSQKVKQNY